MTYMTHPRHGAMHADRHEVERLEKAGWKVVPEPTAAAILAAKQGVKPEAPAIKRKYQRKAAA